MSHDQAHAPHRDAPGPVRWRRLRLGWRQEDLGLAAGRSREQIGRIESGQCVPRVDTALEIARALNCEVSDLFPALHTPTNDKDPAASQVFVSKESDDPASLD